MVSEKDMPKAPQGFAWHARVKRAYVIVELINGSGTVAAQRDRYFDRPQDIEQAVIDAAWELVFEREAVAEIRAKHNIAIGVE